MNDKTKDYKLYLQCVGEQVKGYTKTLNDEFEYLCKSFSQDQAKALKELDTIAKSVLTSKVRYSRHGVEFNIYYSSRMLQLKNNLVKLEAVLPTELVRTIEDNL